MATALKDILAALNREWVEGPHASRFEERHREARKRVASASDEERSGGVLVCESDPVDHLAASLGALAEGAAVWLGYPQWRTTEWDAFYAQGKPTLVFGAAPPPPESPRGDNDQPPPDPEPGQVIVATGGTSGSLRLAVHSLRTLGAAVDSLYRHFGRQPLNCVSVLPPHHVSGFMPAMRALLTGGKLFLPGLTGLEEAFGDDQEDAADPGQYFVSLVPTLLRRGLENPKRRALFKRFRGIFLGGGATHGYWLDRADRQEIPLILTYGMTETAGMVTILPSEEFLAGWRGCGRSLPGCEIRIAGSDGSPYSSGRLLVKSTAICEGYRNGMNLPLDRGWLRTEDEGCFNNSKNLELVGRVDRAINTGGEKVEPGEVERAVGDVSGVRSVLVTGAPDPDWGQRVVCFYTKSREEIKEADIKAVLETRLASHKRPKQFFEVDRLPLDERGKLDHVKIAEFTQPPQLTEETAEAEAEETLKG